MLDFLHLKICIPRDLSKKLNSSKSQKSSTFVQKFLSKDIFSKSFLFEVSSFYLFDVKSAVNYDIESFNKIEGEIGFQGANPQIR